MSTTDKSPSSTTTTVFDFIADCFPNSEPFIRYGFPREGGGQLQEYRLRAIHEPIPNEAITASAIYLITNNQNMRLDRFSDNPHAIEGNGNIVKEIQAECENAERVLYPVYLESDARDNGVTFRTMTDWIQTALQHALGVNADRATYWYSGSRSIHAHAPKFVTHSTLAILKERLEAYCKESGAQLDSAIYKPKQQFRLPGMVHENSGGAFQKVRIDPAWENDEIIRAAGRGVPTPETFTDVLATTFTPAANPGDYWLHLVASEKVIEPPVVEQEGYPHEPADRIRWLQYNAKEFSPYALAEGNSRSVAVVEIKGGAFARKAVRIGDDSRPVYALLPVYFHGARGCAGGEFTKADEHAPLQLSKPDYEKWKYKVGDHVVVIGGKSGRSVIFQVEPWQARAAGHTLIGEDGSRQAALDYLKSEGYDTGKAGPGSSSSASKTARRGRDGKPQTNENTTETEAAHLQRRAEREGIASLSHTERGRVACRLLKSGWDPAWEWFKEQYGTQFKPGVTREQFLSAIKSYPEDYHDVQIPPKP